MARIVLVMHAPLGAAFSACAEHVLGKKPNLTVFDIQPGDQPDLVVPSVLRQLAGMPDEGTLILCDIYGATPFNIASSALKLMTEKGMVAHLITGTNLCMVLKALTDQQENPDKLSENVRLGAMKGIVDVDRIL